MSDKSKKLTVPGTGGKNTVIDSNGINAGGNKITNVAPGVAGTDAVNKSQLDQIGDNTIKLGGNTGTTVVQNLSKTGGLQFNIKGTNGIETSATGSDVTVKLDTATKTRIDNAANNNLFNLTGVSGTKSQWYMAIKANCAPYNISRINSLIC